MRESRDDAFYAFDFAVALRFVDREWIVCHDFVRGASRFLSSRFLGLNEKFGKSPPFPS